jgi:hypothetical protein
MRLAWLTACSLHSVTWIIRSRVIPSVVLGIPDYPTRPLGAFAPLVRRIFSREAHDPRYGSPVLPQG